MIVRIVEMQFKPENVETFKALFEERKEKIRGFPGCRYLEMLQGTAGNNNVFSTYSHWDSEEDLENYRYSELFADTWKTTKVLFSARAKAISFTRLHQLT